MCTTNDITDKPSGKTGTIMIVKSRTGYCGAICFCSDGTIEVNNYNSNTQTITGWKEVISDDSTIDASKVVNTFSSKTYRWYIKNGKDTDDYIELRQAGASPTVQLSFVYHNTAEDTDIFYQIFDQNGNYNIAEASHTHDHSDIKGMASNRVMTSNGSGVLTESSITTTQLGYLNGVTSSIQTQLNAKAPTSHASSATTYGVGTSSNYGHCKTINNLTRSSYVNGEALSANQGKILKDLIDDTCAKGNHLNNSSSSKYKALNIYWSGVNYGSNMFLCNIGHIFLVNAPQATSSFKSCTYTKLLNSYNSSYVCDVQSCQVIQQSSTQWRLKFVFQQNTINFSPIIMSLTPGITIDRIETSQS